MRKRERQKESKSWIKKSVFKTVNWRNYNRHYFLDASLPLIQFNSLAFMLYGMSSSYSHIIGNSWTSKPQRKTWESSWKKGLAN